MATRIYGFRLGDETIGAIDALKKTHGSRTAVIEHWAKQSGAKPEKFTAEEAKTEAVKASVPITAKVKPVGYVLPDATMSYKDFVAAMPVAWTISERAGRKTVYNEHGMSQRIFQEGRDY